MELNLVSLLIAAIIPAIIGFVYYHPKVLGTAWMNAMGKTEEELKEGFNMPVAMILGVVLSFLMAFLIKVIVETSHKDVNEAGELIWDTTHTFGHGAFHGLFYGLLFAMPIIINGGIYERKSWKHMLINVGYWVITISVMTGFLDWWG